MGWYIISVKQFNTYMNGVVKKLNGRVIERGAALWEESQFLFSNCTILLADLTENGIIYVSECENANVRNKLEINVGNTEAKR